MGHGHGFHQEGAFIVTHHPHGYARTQGQGTVAQSEPERTPESHPSPLARFDGFINDGATGKELKAVGLSVVEFHLSCVEFDIYIFVNLCRSS